MPSIRQLPINNLMFYFPVAEGLALLVLSSRQRRVLHPSSSPRCGAGGRPSLHTNHAYDQLISQLNQEREARLQVEADLQAANNQLLSLLEHEPNVQQVTSKLINDCYRSKVPVEDIVNGVLSTMMSRSKMQNEINCYILNKEELFSDASKCFQQKMYQELNYKFCGWLCLQQLDLAATVSFQAYDTTCRIEFAEDDRQKYRRGLFHSRHKLTRLCRQLESHGAELLPYHVTNNSVKFDVCIATQFILDRHGLWCHVLDKDHVQLAATVDGGSLSWNVTQVSAGVKLVDPRSIEPTTGTPLFGVSGFDKVQS